MGGERGEGERRRGREGEKGRKGEGREEERRK